MALSAKAKRDQLAWREFEITGGVGKLTQTQPHILLGVNRIFPITDKKRGTT